MRNRMMYSCLLCILLLVLFTACGGDDSVPILKVILQSSEADASTYEYLTVYHNGKSSSIDAFEPDDAAYYAAVHGDFDSYIENNTVHNILKATTLIDENNEEFEADEVIAAMMQSAADSIEHDIWKFQAITTEGRYFAFVELNVNWQSPCVLYEYDAAENILIELCRWDGVDLIGISIS